MILPFDILGDALEALGGEYFEVRRFVASEPDSAGNLVPFYASGKITAFGQIQPADGSVTDQAGFNTARKAVNVWTETEIHTVETHGGADLLIIRGEVYQARDIADWHEHNGWQRITAVLAPPALQKYA